jgi:hypothetical protein
MHRVFRLAAPGSIAEAYVKEQYDVTLALQQAGQSLDASTFTKVGDSYKSCGSGSTQAKSCVTWSNVEAHGSRIANFTVSGKSLKGRLSMGSGKAAPVGSLGTVQVKASYQSVQSDALFIAFKLKAGSLPLMVDQTDSAYLTKNGTQVTAQDVYGPDKLLPHAVGNYYMAFPHVSVGGRLVLNVIDQQNYENASATIPTT